MAQNQEYIFPEGVRAFSPSDKAPEFILASVVITPNQLVSWLKKNDGLMTEYNKEKQIKLTLLKSKEGIPFFQVDTFKPDGKKTSNKAETVSDDLPF